MSWKRHMLKFALFVPGQRLACVLSFSTQLSFPFLSDNRRITLVSCKCTEWFLVVQLLPTAPSEAGLNFQVTSTKSTFSLLAFLVSAWFCTARLVLVSTVPETQPKVTICYEWGQSVSCITAFKVAVYGLWKVCSVAQSNHKNENGRKPLKTFSMLYNWNSFSTTGLSLSPFSLSFPAHNPQRHWSFPVLHHYWCSCRLQVSVDTTKPS